MHVRPIDPKTATVPVQFLMEDPEGLTGGHDGQAAVQAALGQNLLEVALGHNINIEHACGGVCACSTCHVHVQSGLESCSKATDDEEDELDKAPALAPESRLACQCVPDGSRDLLVLIPKWNRNHVKEGHH